ncbi:MAG: hypothetical protein PHG14_11810 [Desulfobacter postgatei]|uniref:hypothetical protein n=1 Tax=Desulfobacter postgatei TaxID=2293 RepID=UPI0023F1C97A|nr:hypothetical protein [Desulfobacter postgatei]MDD4274399.1 hypothetical protein [Desulfobacter postgatei]
MAKQVLSVFDMKAKGGSQTFAAPQLLQVFLPGSYFCKQLCFSCSTFHIAFDEAHFGKPGCMFFVALFALHQE